ncbi:MAG: hypothetical protein ACKVTZ_03970 [Bacteroidia bacterium]
MKKSITLFFVLSLSAISILFAQSSVGSLLPNMPTTTAVKKVGAKGPSVATNDMMMPKVVKVQTTSGAFQVEAWKEIGVKFRNDWDEPMLYTFNINPNNQWSYGDASNCTTIGRKENKFELRYGEYVGALVAVKSDGKYKALTETGVMKFVIKPGETVFFIMNDRKGHYGDNSGQTYIRWTCERATAENASR